MIFTLAWKELREHQSIWVTMVIMTVVLGFSLPKIVALQDPGLAAPVAALTILGMAACYGVVCGAMMFAGEQEGGTLVFLDIFLGRRGLLWMGKFAIGVVLVLAQAWAVALALWLLKQEPPEWAMAIVGRDAKKPDANVWFLFLPLVSAEAYAWGLLGSSFAQRVLAGAAVAAIGVTPVLLLAIIAPPIGFFTLASVVALVVLAGSYAKFLSKSQEWLAPPLEFEGPVDRKEEFLERFEEFEKNGDIPSRKHAPDTPTTVPLASANWSEPKSPDVEISGDHATPAATAVADNLTPLSSQSARGNPAPAPSPSEVLWWLTLKQAWPVIWCLAAAAFLIGWLSTANAQVLWPLATLLLGVACGNSAFAPEQRDLSYQFLAAQHLPLKTFWRFRILFWLAVAIAETLVLVFAHYLHLAIQRVIAPGDQPAEGFQGTLPQIMGPMLFFGVWLFYGFCIAQVFVWLCRKIILALLLSFLVAAAAISLWLPSLLCGMNGWQVWAPPLLILVATLLLIRAWAGGRIYERKPVAALVGFGAAGIFWALLTFGFRAWQVPDVGKPIDPVAFRADLPLGNDNAAAKAIHAAISQFGEPNDPWLAPMAEASRLPVGVLEMPRADGQPPLLRHLPACQKITDELLRQARAKKGTSDALEHLVQILALSRNLRNKAPLESYLAGVQTEASALNGLDQLLARAKPDPKLLHKVLDEVNRHANETPPPLDCLHTECFSSGGFLANSNTWTLAAPGAVKRIPEQWLAGSIALSLEVPHEAQRSRRIWQAVWAGLFRAVRTPHWQLPIQREGFLTQKSATRKVLDGWLPAAQGPGAGLTHADMVRLVDASWLSDERLFCPVQPLREAATRARWRVDSTRLVVALSLYRTENGKSAQELRDLVPKYFPAGVPADPYSGQPFRYGVAPENQRQNGNGPARGKEIVWSTGPDRIDHGGRINGAHLADDDARWPRGEFDLIMAVPQWP
jgi:hypothetical protein